MVSSDLRVFMYVLAWVLTLGSLYLLVVAILFPQRYRPKRKGSSVSKDVRVGLGSELLIDGEKWVIIDRQYKKNTTSGLPVRELVKGKLRIVKPGFVAMGWIIQHVETGHVGEIPAASAKKYVVGNMFA